MKSKRNILISLTLILITLLLYFVAKSYRDFFFGFYPYISVSIIKEISFISNIVPFSIWEIVAGLIVIYLIYTIIRGLFNKKILDSITKSILVVVVLATTFVNIWGLNYYSPALYERLGYTNSNIIDINELYQLTDFLCDKCLELSEKVKRDSNGRMLNEFDKWNTELENCYTSVSIMLPFISNTSGRVKHLVSSNYFSERGITGIFICLTGESSITNEVYNAAIPLTMAHEVAHKNAIAREDEANFIAYLACINSEIIELNYSAYFEAFLYCASELIDKSLDTYSPIREKLSGSFLFDLKDNNEFYSKRTDEQKEEANNNLYNSYLQSFEIENGMESYNDMVKLLLCYYFD